MWEKNITQSTLLMKTTVIRETKNGTKDIYDGY